MWSKATLPHQYTSGGNATTAASSSSGDVVLTSRSANSSESAAETFTMSQQEQYSEHFLGPPEKLFQILPCARRTSKVAAFLSSVDERSTFEPKAPPPKHSPSIRAALSLDIGQPQRDESF